MRISVRACTFTILDTTAGLRALFDYPWVTVEGKMHGTTFFSFPDLLISLIQHFLTQVES